jgi:hypothetical protein
VQTLTPSSIGIEVLDDPGADPQQVRRMLTEIARANRWLGAHRAMRRALATLVDPADRGTTLRLLDVGTGAGDLPRVAKRWLARRGIRATSVGLERHRSAAVLAQENGIRTVVGCGTCLPVRPAANSDQRTANSAAIPPAPIADRCPRFADIVLLSQLLHHFDDATAVTMLSEAAQVATRGVIVLDLRPSRSAGALFPIAGRVLGLSRDTIDDGVTSLARGRDADALEALASGAGLAGAVSRNLPWGRAMLTWRRP